MQFRIGIIGATGYIGRPYRQEIRASTADARIVALCARRRELLEQAGREDAADLLTDDWREVVNHPDVNLVMVLTPDALHHDPVIAAAEAKKHVFCEKPVGKDAREARSMWDAVKQRGLLHYVPFWTRYVPVFVRAKEIVADGRLGMVRGVVYRWHNPRPSDMPFTWRDDARLSAAGSIADVGSHAYDALRFILGKEASSVLVHAETIMPAKPVLGDVNLAEALAWGSEHQEGQIAERKQGTSPDYAQIAMRFGGGCIGMIMVSHASYYRKGFSPDLELHGTQASLSVDRLTGELKFADDPEPARSLMTVGDDGHCNRFQQHVFPALRQRAAGQVTDHPGLDDGWRVQIFTDAAVASASRGGWVDLAEFE